MSAYGHRARVRQEAQGRGEVGAGGLRGLHGSWPGPCHSTGRPVLLVQCTSPPRDAKHTHPQGECWVWLSHLGAHHSAQGRVQLSPLPRHCAQGQTAQKGAVVKVAAWATHVLRPAVGPGSSASPIRLPAAVCLGNSGGWPSALHPPGAGVLHPMQKLADRGGSRLWVCGSSRGTPSLGLSLTSASQNHLKLGG